MADEDNPKSVPRMLGEFLREVAVLVIVFYPLDMYINSLVPGFKAAESVSARKIIGISLLLLAAGMALEKIDFGLLAIRIIDPILGILTSWRIRLSRRQR